MNKVTVLVIFIVFIAYSIAGLFVEIPPAFNNIFYGIITIGAIFFCIFYLNIGDAIKDRFNDNRQKMAEKNQSKKQ